MAHAALSYVALSSIDPNPFRNLKNYPFDQHKLDALMRSIEDVGLWEGMIGRKVSGGYQLAFGHHRWEAARKKKLATVPLIIRDLTDEQMVGFMGRENLEDFNSDFLAQLNAWEAALTMRSATTDHEVQAVDAARLLGWTRERHDRTSNKMNDTASACHVALVLIGGGHLDRADLTDMTVAAARLVVERIHSRMEMLDKLGKMGNRPAIEIERDKKIVGRAGKKVAKGVREGKLAHRNIRAEIDYEAVKAGTAKGKASPLFAAFVKEVSDSIHKMLVSDNVATRLSEMEKALPHVTMDEDRAALRRVDFALAEHVETSANWRGRLAPKGQRVVPFKLLKKEGDFR